MLKVALIRVSAGKRKACNGAVAAAEAALEAARASGDVDAIAKAEEALKAASQPRAKKARLRDQKVVVGPVSDWAAFAESIAAGLIKLGTSAR